MMTNLRSAPSSRQKGKFSLSSVLILVNLFGFCLWTFLIFCQEIPEDKTTSVGPNRLLHPGEEHLQVQQSTKVIADNGGSSTSKEKKQTEMRKKGIKMTNELFVPPKLYWKGKDYVDTGNGRRRIVLPSDLRLATLKCEAYGGPSEEDAQEMVYWQEIPSDHLYTSPFYNKNAADTKYLTFEIDKGGFNNIRMAMETMLALAHAMGRTVVLPPQQELYLWHKRKAAEGHEQRLNFGLEDFFPMEEIAAKQEGIDIITMEEFLQREAMSGKLRNTADGSVCFPPYNRTNWNGYTDEMVLELFPWLEEVSVMPPWNPLKCLASFPHSTNPEAAKNLNDLWEGMRNNLPPAQRFIDKPVAVYASPRDRLAENHGGRVELCMYEPAMQDAKVIHFHGKEKYGGGRLLIQSYAFLYFENWKEDLWTKRFVRDQVRYVDELQCAAARIVNAIRKRVRDREELINQSLITLGIRNATKTSDGAFDAFHVRRGEFQYKRTRISAEELYKASKDVIKEGTTVYIATDERDKTFFEDLAAHYDLIYLDDYLHLIKGINTNWYGMIDQLVASRSRYFFGCYFSTFTGYINRLRGYHADRLKNPGFAKGIVQSIYYAFPEHRDRMLKYWPVSGAIYAREFPVSWRNIDQGIGTLDEPYET